MDIVKTQLAYYLKQQVASLQVRQDEDDSTTGVPNVANTKVEVVGEDNLSVVLRVAREQQPPRYFEFRVKELGDAVI